MEFKYFTTKIEGPILHIDIDFSEESDNKQKEIIVNLKRVLCIHEVKTLASDKTYVEISVARKKEKINESKIRGGNISEWTDFRIPCSSESEISSLRNLIFEAHQKASHCNRSEGIHEGLTVGHGEPDDYGYFNHGCYFCAREIERTNPEFGPVWPFKSTGIIEEIEALNIFNKR